MARPPQARVTLGLVIANILVYGLVVLVGGQAVPEGGMELLVPDQNVLIRLGLQVPSLVTAGEWWRLIMPIFLHLGILHLAMNTLVLWVTGRVLERDIGSGPFFFMYVLAGFMGFALSQVERIGGGGASGAVAGILGATIAYRRLTDGHFRSPVTMQALQLVVLNAVFGLAMTKVNNYAHLGGFLSGGVLGAAFAGHLHDGWRWVWRAGAAASGVAVVASVVLMLRWEAPPVLALSAGQLGQAQEAERCLNEVIGALDATGHLGAVGAQAGLRCLARVDPIDEAADDALSSVRRGLQLVVRGQRERVASDDAEGHRRIDEGIMAFRQWATGEAPGVDRGAR